WVKIFEGSLSDPDGFKVTEESSPKIHIPISVFSPLYKVVASCPNSQPWWWLAGSLVERAGTSQVIDALEVGRYVVPRDREVLLRPRFRDVPFYYYFEPAYWHTQADVTVWAWIGNENQTPKSSLESEMFAIATRSMENHLGLVNPHGITLQLLGGASQADLNAIAQDIQALQNSGVSQTELDLITNMANAYTDQSLEEHLADINPHDITPEKIGAVRSSLFEELEGEVEVLKNQTISESDFGNLFTSYATDIETLPITPTQIGAATPEDVQNAIDIMMFDHTDVNDNPHGITPAQIGAVSEQLQESDLVLGSQWKIYSNSAWTAPKVQKQGKICHVTGLVVRTVDISNLTTIATLPEGFRPNKKLMFSSWLFSTNTSMPCRIDVSPHGEIILMFPHLASIIGWLNLASISFISS
ncbi:hypothetical protein, partial [Vibrio sp.]|uniref:hypothetical protein n=1 Tax=Vibrio sp. TaxID=678 RepID=UPI003D1075C3